MFTPPPPNIPLHHNHLKALNVNYFLLHYYIYIPLNVLFVAPFVKVLMENANGKPTLVKSYMPSLWFETNLVIIHGNSTILA